MVERSVKGLAENRLASIILDLYYFCRVVAL